jgi:hypothetical protein
MTIGSLLCLNVGCGKGAPAKFEEFAKRLVDDLDGTRLSKPILLLGPVSFKVENSMLADSSHVATLTFLTQETTPEGPVYWIFEWNAEYAYRGNQWVCKKVVKTIYDVKDASKPMLRNNELKKEIGKEVIQLTGDEVAQNRTDEIVCLLSDCVAP